MIEKERGLSTPLSNEEKKHHFLSLWLTILGPENK